MEDQTTCSNLAQTPMLSVLDNVEGGDGGGDDSRCICSEADANTFEKCEDIFLPLPPPLPKKRSVPITHSLMQV